jgi:beta-lactamase class A
VWILLTGFLIVVALAGIAFVVHERSHEAYPLLDEAVQELSIDAFQEEQARIRVTYTPLRKQVEALTNNTQGTYSVFFEDLRSGADFGVNERMTYVPKSLFKLPTSIAVLKAVERGSFELDDRVRLTEDVIDSSYGTLYIRGAGSMVTVDELLTLSIGHSDNTANNALRSIIPFSAIEEARLALGVPYPEANSTEYKISPRNYASVLRSLYMAGYLRRPYSQYTLELLTLRRDASLLARGVPDEVIVANKIGEDAKVGLHHDCGIVYHPKNPYILCVMSASSEEEARAVIPAISAMVYEYVDADTGWRRE